MPTSTTQPNPWTQQALFSASLKTPASSIRSCNFSLVISANKPLSQALTRMHSSLPKLQKTARFSNIWTSRGRQALGQAQPRGSLKWCAQVFTRWPQITFRSSTKKKNLLSNLTSRIFLNWTPKTWRLYQSSRSSWSSKQLNFKMKLNRRSRKC